MHVHFVCVYVCVCVCVCVCVLGVKKTNAYGVYFLLVGVVCIADLKSKSTDMDTVRRYHNERREHSAAQRVCRRQTPHMLEM